MNSQPASKELTLPEALRKAYVAIGQVYGYVGSIDEAADEIERLQRELESRHTLDCDMVKHPNCTRCSCESESLSGGNPGEKSVSRPADHRGIVSARSSEGGIGGQRSSPESIQSCEPVGSDTASEGAGEPGAIYKRKVMTPHSPLSASAHEPPVDLGQHICIDDKYHLGYASTCFRCIEHVFKNFHRLLCHRFGYAHDEKDWQRDQLSLIEWIANRNDQPPRPSTPPPVCEHSDSGQHECKHCDATHAGGSLIETIWEVADDSEEDPQTGDVTIDSASWSRLLQALWDLGGLHQRRLRNLGWSPSTKSSEHG